MTNWFMQIATATLFAHLLQKQSHFIAYSIPIVSSISKTLIASSTKSVQPTSSTSIKKVGVARSITRNVLFWGRAGTIYSTYKILQLRVRSKKIWNRLIRRDPLIVNSTRAMWEHQHDLNSQRMINLCLGLRGFYLKTGQFLGTRYDFMPSQYTKKLSALHDNVPPLTSTEIRKVLESELHGSLESYFSALDLDKPIGSASIAQVHKGTWRATGEPCAVKIQYPNAERLMKGDLRNLRMLAEFLQRTELKFDILSSIKELQKNIHNEFDFINEAKNMDLMKAALSKSVPDVSLPRSLFASKRVLVMSFVDGINLGQTSEFSGKGLFVPLWIKQQFGRKLLDVLSKAWGEMIFNQQFFNSDPHPGNIRIPVGSLGGSRKIGLLDWGQMKRITNDSTYNFARLVEAMNSRDRNKTCAAFFDLGVRVGDPNALSSVEGIAVSMLDTRVVQGYDMDPFSPNNALKYNSVKRLPTELYFLVRTVQLLRGIAYGFQLDYSLSKAWTPYARGAIQRIDKLR